MNQPILLYTTEEHGCSLTTFYVRVENYDPTLLLIKTCNNEVPIKQIYFVVHQQGLDNVCLFLSFRYLGRIVPQSGLKEIKKMIAVTDKRILVLVKHLYLACIRPKQSTHGSEWKPTIFIMPKNCLWQPIKKWSP